VTRPHPASPEFPVFPFPNATGLDVYPLLAKLREDEPVSPVHLALGGTAYLVTRYADVKRVFTDPAFSRAAAQRPESAVVTKASRIPGTLLNMDQPDHTRMRKLVARAFTARSVERLQPRTAEIANGLLEAMVASGPPADFVREFATALPALVISEMLGIPGGDRDQVREWVDVSLSTGVHPESLVDEMLSQFLAYLAGLIATKRQAPGDDLASALIQARDVEDRLSEAELISTMLILVAGGYETTAGLLSNSLLVLDKHPDQFAVLREDPSRIPGAVEELLRYVPIAWSALERITLEDVELGGVRIPANSTVVPIVYSANQDADFLPDGGRLDLTRPPLTHHLTFGYGIHHCLGAQLARMELRTAFGILLRRLPRLRPAVPETELTFRAGVLTIGPTTLPVTW
jgi:cytochrome P450